MTPRPSLLLAFVLGLTLLLAAPGCRGTSGSGGEEKAPASAVVTVTLPVEGMTCGSCEQGIQHEVGRLAGVTAVKASHTEKTARVTFDEAKIPLSRIVETINKLGYKASPVPVKEERGEPVDPKKSQE